MSCNKTEYTISFDEKVKGWTSFHSFIPDFMVGMNNVNFSFKNGELYEHDSEEVERNTFYGVQYPSKISVMVNEEPSEIKELQNIELEGNTPWYIDLAAYLNGTENPIKSTIKKEEFERKEGIWHAFARRNEDVLHFDSRSSYGIGVVEEVGIDFLVVQGFNTSLLEGDNIVNAVNMEGLGEVVFHSTVDGYTTITFSTVDSSKVSVGDFLLGVKDARVEGGNLRGYAIRLDLEVTDSEKVELFAVNSNIIKSYT